MLVTGGYDMTPTWLKGGAGYQGTVVEMTDEWATVELDRELVVEGRWHDFNNGSRGPIREVSVARGRWLALSHGWVGQGWSEPIHRLHVGLCSERPNLGAIPQGGGVGAWVESHATMQRLP